MFPTEPQLPDVLEFQCQNTRCRRNGEKTEIRLEHLHRFGSLLAFPRLRCDGCLREPALLTTGVGLG